MKILDENGNEVTNPDLALGYITNDVERIHHDEIPEVQSVPAKTHYEVIKEYPNGGKDVKEVIDEEGVEGHIAIPAWDEDRMIQRYILYTPEQLANIKSINDSIEANKTKPSFESRIQATEDVLIQMMLGGNSNV